MNWLAVGAGTMFIGVALGAFGAHGLKEKVTADLLAVYQTGVHYHLIHALALVLVGVLSRQGGMEKVTNIVGWLFLVGILVFSGSLYALALTNIKILGAITPLGGLCFLSGWLYLAIRAGMSAGSK